MAKFIIAHQEFEFDRERVERALTGVLPDPIRDHYVVVNDRRYPPKQVLNEVTGLDRADFTTHQARGVLKRLGFVAARANGRAPTIASRSEVDAPNPLAPYVGKWVALDSPTEVLVAADTPQEILAWVARHKRRVGYGMFRVPRETWEIEGPGPE